MRGENRISARITWTSASGIISDKPHSSHKDDHPLRKVKKNLNPFQTNFRFHHYQLQCCDYSICSSLTTLPNTEMETRSETESEEDKTNDG